MNARLPLLGCLLLFPALAGAEIVEIKSLREVLPALTSRPCLLVVDIDNTLIEPTQNLGSDQWFYYLQLRYQRREKLPLAAARAKSLAVWNRVQWLIRVRPVESDGPRLIREQQDRGVPTLGLTARVPSLAGRTLAQLESVGIKLDRRTVSPKEHHEGAELLFRRGILFVGEGRDKGEALLRFLRRVGRRPAKIVFVDDKLHNVRDVERALRQHRVPAALFRYGAADERVRAFEADVADPELYFGGIIGERAASTIRRAQQPPEQR